MFQSGLLRRLEPAFLVLMPLLDVLLFVLGCRLAIMSSERFLTGVPVHYDVAIFVTALVLPAWFGRVGLYRRWRGQGVLEELRKIIAAWCAFVALLALAALLTKTGALYSRVWIAHSFVWVLLLLLVVRLVIRASANYVRARGFNCRYVVLLGEAGRCERVRQQVSLASWAGLDVVSVVEMAEDEELAVQRLQGLLSDRQIDQLWLALDVGQVELVNRIQQVAAKYPLKVVWVPDLAGVQMLKYAVNEVAGLTVVTLQGNPLSFSGAVVKAIEDRVLALVILLLMAIPMILIATAIKISSKGPVLFAQVRHGVSGKPITVYKFRTMVVHDEQGVITSASQNDSRITPLGSFLRKTSLDELPQFFNVLQGNMSIVGPRPHSVTQEGLFTDYYHLYPMRHKIKPGITGWAQVNGLRGEVDSAEKLRQRVEHDIYYLENWSLWLDVRIIIRTAIGGWVGPNAY